MELSFAKCESILNTLPIGYYAGRRIGITLDREEETSFYSPMEDKIVVSYPIIASRLAQVEDGSCDEEEAVRSMLYHEVSHAILTPANAFCHPTARVNIFEDERIESVLRHYYHGVNFRKQIYDVHGGKVPKATNPDQAFFNAVRFGLGTAKVQKEINRMLKDFSSINRDSKYYQGSPSVSDYEYEIDELYKLITREWKTDPEQFNAAEGKQGEGNGKQMDSIKGAKGSKSEGEGDSEGEEVMGVADDESEPFKGDPHEVDVDIDELKRAVGASLSTNPNLDDVQIQKLVDFQKTAEMIIGNFNKKNKGGSGINAYSGVFNPRAITRQDYRYFERPMTTQGNNKFGTCHLNLIIDSSGSFCYNEDVTNGILAALSEIERKNRNFTMDVAFINHDFRLCKTVRERKMKANGGNAIPEDMKEILMRLQKPQTCNYNIILFDGDAICQGYSGRDSNKVFSVFDMKQTTLITDPENEQYMHPPFTSTKVVVTKNYTSELIDHIIHALTIAFA